MPRVAIVLIVFALSLRAASDNPATAIRQVLDDQRGAWNRGDVRAFMETYEDSDATTFVGATVTKGRAQILASYLKRYASPEAMGTLAFSGVEVRPLCAVYASVIGKWKLSRAAQAGGDASGIFTLLFRKTAVGWKIILDHTH